MAPRRDKTAPELIQDALDLYTAAQLKLACREAQAAQEAKEAREAEAKQIVKAQKDRNNPAWWKPFTQFLLELMPKKKDEAARMFEYRHFLESKYNDTDQKLLAEQRKNGISFGDGPIIIENFAKWQAEKMHEKKAKGGSKGGMAAQKKRLKELAEAKKKRKQ